MDLELDVKVFINSGKCVLHTKPKEEDLEARYGYISFLRKTVPYLVLFFIYRAARKRSERSGSGFDTSLLAHHNTSTSSPLSTRKLIRGGGGGGANASQTRIKSPFGNTPGATDVTVFHIPGLDVKVGSGIH